MVKEASKTNQARAKDFFTQYCSGKVIDVGSADDLVVPHAEPFDLVHGDAQHILKYRTAGSYDCVHSSHCLEHMRDVPEALRQWWELVKPGGFLIVVVPDEDLYEQGIFPSLFNRDHKATFRFHRRDSWSPKSYNLEELAQRLPNARVLSYIRQDLNYDYRWQRRGLTPWRKFLYDLNFFRWRVFMKLHLLKPRIENFFNRLFFFLGGIFDQTQEHALAQIQIIIQKNP